MKELFVKIREADIRNIVAVITSVGSLLIVYSLIVKEVPDKNHDILIASVGYILGGANGLVYGYLFGKSKLEKSDTIADPTSVTKK